MAQRVMHHYEAVDSTNTLAYEMARQGACHGTVVSADRQTLGRGRAGRQFVSPKGGLYFSLILRPCFEPEVLPLITLAAGVGVCNAIRKSVDVKVHLKWPNDLYLEGRKLGGILTESGPIRSGASPEFLIIGAGLNVQTDPDQFSSSLRGKVISLYHDPECCVDNKKILSSCVDEVLVAVQMLRADREQLLARWRSLDYLQGRNLEFFSEKGMVAAIGIGLGEDGRYIVRDAAGVEQHVLAGDINPINLKS